MATQTEIKTLFDQEIYKTLSFLAVLKIFDAEILHRSLQDGGPLAEKIGRAFDPLEASGVASVFVSLLLQGDMVSFNSEVGYEMTESALAKAEQVHHFGEDILSIKTWALEQYGQILESDPDLASVYAERMVALM